MAKSGYMTQIVKAPFSGAQLRALKLRQAGKKTHPKHKSDINRYICPNHSGGDIHVLEAKKEGLACSDCTFVQDWAISEED